MIKPESVITYVGLLALVASLPIVVQGFRRRGTGEKYQSLFWVQRAPQIAVLLNVVIIVVAFELPQQRMVNVFSQIPTAASDLIAWSGVAIYLSGIVFVVGGWYSRGANFSPDAEMLAGCEVSPSNKRLQLTPNSSLQSIHGTVLAAGAVPQRWRSALLGAAEPQNRWAAPWILPIASR